ncbi:MAG: T9SS type A sorting domain-containing protein [Bacteroidales bacterium]|nr:T9SS type A sorting domain-containing protein [Bacteroidales bacterium]
MKKRLILALLILGSVFSFASATNNSFEIISRNSNELIVKVKVNDFRLQAVKSPEMLGYLPDLEDGAHSLNKGFPDLQHLTASFIKKGQEVQVSIIDQKVKKFSDIEILPSKGNLYRDQNPSEIPYQKGNIYKIDSFYPRKIVRKGKEYHFRDFSGFPLHITPMQYNPVSKTFRLYTELTIKISFPGVQFNRTPKHINADFASLYKQHFLNFQSSRYTALPEKGEMLVFTHQNFDQDIQSFVDWKNKIGIPTKLVRIDTLGAGNASAIKNYISTYYQNHNLSFVLLVGDANYVPTNSISSGDSDNYYGYLSGNDSYSEVMIGRFSVENSAHVNTMVQRTKMYELGLSNNGNWLNTSLGIASEQGPGDDNEMDYDHMRNMHTDLQSYTYTSLLEMFDGSQGGNDAGGNPSSSMVSQAVNAGLGNILYTGHGSTYSWGTSGFSNSDIDQLTNTTAWPFIWSVACVNGNFVNNTSFAESWTRATNNGEPTGAIATLMSTINQSWDPPMHAQDEMVDILIESDSNNIKRTFGGISMNGCMAMNDAYGYQGDEMTETWTIFGDPSFMIRTDTSKTQNITSLPALFLGDTSVTINVPVNDARVALSLNNKLLDVEYVTNGTATLTFPPFSSPDTMDLAVVAYNYDIYFAEVPVMQASGPFMVFKGYNIDDSQGNGDQNADQGEKIVLDVQLENLGLDDAQGVSAKIYSTDTSVVITKDSAYWGAIVSKDSAYLSGAFSMNLKPGIANGYLIDINMDISDNAGDSWQTSFEVPVEAPQTEALLLTVLDDSLGNGDGRLNAGETATIMINVKNTGNDMFSYGWSTLISSSTYIDVLKPFESINDLAEGNSLDIPYKIKVDSTMPDGTTVRFDWDLSAGNYSLVNSFFEVIGNINEDFETKDFSRFAWNPAGTYGWEIDSTVSYAGNASAVSGLPYNQNSSSSVLVISINSVKDDSISFYRKVSSEADYDFMKFHMDNQLKGEWSGYKSWERFSYFVPEGQHTFKWTYEKDAYVSSGTDKAWIDDVGFPPISTPASVEENFTVSSVDVYPNPADDIQNLSFALSNKTSVSVELLDVNGRKVREVFRGMISAGNHQLNYSFRNMNSGLYFLRVLINDKQHVFKVIH